jgi:hypothetical protein
MLFEFMAFRSFINPIQNWPQIVGPADFAMDAAILNCTIFPRPPVLLDNVAIKLAYVVPIVSLPDGERSLPRFVRLAWPPNSMLPCEERRDRGDEPNVRRFGQRVLRCM